MRINPNPNRRAERGSIVAYFIFLLVMLTALSSVCAFVAQTVSASQRHNDMVQALALAEGGACFAAAELELALTNQSAPFVLNLVNNPAGDYAKNTTLSSSQSNVYQRIIMAPFSGESVLVQIWTPNVPAPLVARIVGSATVGKVTQSASLQVQVRFGYGGAVISDNFGAPGEGVSKQSALQGNVSFKANAHPGFILDGGGDFAVRANGYAHIGNNVILRGAISDGNANTADEIPDYTAEGSADQLFDFQRFIAVADLTPAGPSPSRNNHFTNMTDFRASLITNSAAHPYQGVVVVDIKKYYGDPGQGNAVESGDLADLSASDYPNGINVRGTLVFNFADDVGSSDTILIGAPLNINAADLSGLNPANPGTYTTGHPAAISDSAKNPLNIDITSKGFQNFAANDDLPALIYNIGMLTIQGNANVSGVVYTPGFLDLEETGVNQVQYFKGSLIAGSGVYVENGDYSTTIVSYDPNAIDLLATSRNKGKRLKALYWQ